MKQLLLSILMMLLPLLANAELVEINGIYYNLSTNTNTAEVTHHPYDLGYYSGDIVIPETVNYEGISYSVTSIGWGAFFICSGLTSITIPNSVTSIGGYAFAGCSSLTSITIPNSVTFIGESAFSGCSSLTSVTIPHCVTEIGYEAFSYCSGLTSITIPNSVTSIGYGAFSGCENLVTIKVENGNTIYDSRNDCNAIVRTADNELIAGCSNTVIPNSVTSLAVAAFEGCSLLTSIIIPNSVATIGEKAFYRCTSLTSISISDGVIDIGYWAFRDCSSLSSIVFPNSITRIEDEILLDCRGLTSVTIPSSVTSIGEGAFEGCDNLTSVNIFDIAAWCRIQYKNPHCNPLCYAHHLYLNGKEVKNLVIPDGVTSIGKYAFDYCRMLTSITIPNSVTSIGTGAFYGCDGLISVISYIEDPFTVDDAFPSWDKYGNNNIILYVPIGTKAKYEETSGWWNKNGHNRFKNIVEMDIQPVEDGQTIDIGDEIDENTNLDGNIMGNIYFSIRDENGEYNPAEGCIVIKKPSDDSDIDGKDIFGEDFKDSYTGIVFKVGAGKGTINVQAQTTGNMVLKVKIGDGEPVEIELEGKMNISIPYNVSEDTYVYIYGGLNTSNNAKGMRKAESADGTLKIYGIEVDSKANDIESLEVSQDDIATIYNLNGHRINSLQRGVNIIRMNDGTVRKVVVK